MERVWVKSVTNFRSPETERNSAVIWVLREHPVSIRDEFYVQNEAKKILYNFVVYNFFI